MASDLMDAQVSSCLSGLGGSKEWDEFESSHCGKNMDLIKQYVNGEIDSVTAIYIAMHRESITPNADAVEKSCTGRKGTGKDDTRTN